MNENRPFSAKKMNDEQLVGEIKTGVAKLCAMINEADKRKINVNFSINKPPGIARGGYKVTKLDISRSL